MPTRRLLLGGAGAVALGAATAGTAKILDRSSAPGRPVGAQLAAAAVPAGALPLTIVNHTYRYTNAQIRVYIVGTDLGTGRQVASHPDGSTRTVSAADNGADGFADLSIPLVDDGDTRLAVPANMSGRIYVSIGDPIRFRVVTDGAGNAALQHPAGWVASDPSYRVLHDFVEFTHNPAGMFCNTTMVDMFSVPLSIRLRGAADQTAGTIPRGGRDAIFADLRAASAFAPLVVDDLRVIAPGHGIESGIFPAGYYDGYIDAVWNRYASTPLTVDAGGATRTGRVRDGVLRFDGGVAPISRPSTRDVLFCAGALAAANDGLTGPVAAVLGAGFNRSTLLTGATQPTGDPAGFYTDAVTNVYSKVMHAHAADGRAYGFPFDDVGGFASYVQDTTPTSMTLSLTPF
ncbi:putative glycosyl hydrolase [Frankia canadensis]|uniref:Putative glycosyl hydrolase n=1 Tax=Frankia canadensis TaxID=1836972 RepID=A0A2I2KKT3_9ACTN|nr:beta-1,3-glucanase family protein [Frankia canadensis]SNQ46254.1 putative glycosyl hydrolase [Frankia canadensis]SOU53544.1 putative glycosyl hydrolase [Frankia canadensis]